MNLVRTHILGLKHWLEGRNCDVLKIDSSHRFFVRQVIVGKQAMSGPVKVIEADYFFRDYLLRDSRGKAKALIGLMGWQPHFLELKDTVSCAWNWHQLSFMRGSMQ